MQLIYDDKKYRVTDESVYFDFSVTVESMDEACNLVDEFCGMSDYSFNEVSYTDMVVTRRGITLENDMITVNVRLRQKTPEELLRDELESLRSELKTIAESASKSDASRINALLEKGVK